MCPLFKCTAGAFKQHLKICFADFQPITAKRQLLRTHYLYWHYTIGLLCFQGEFAIFGKIAQNRRALTVHLSEKPLHDWQGLGMGFKYHFDILSISPSLRRLPVWRIIFSYTLATSTIISTSHTSNMAIEMNASVTPILPSI